jgi:NAD-dependent SIR2 family protein deacetylase
MNSHHSKMSSTKINANLPQEGLWNDVIWTTATRKAFRKDPLTWYNTFWMPHFMQATSTTAYKPKPNAGHAALQELLAQFPNCKQITQNIDGLQPPQEGLIEAHGRLNLYKCCPDSDDDSDSENDDDSDNDDSEDSQRRVQLGHRAKSRERYDRHLDPARCPYQFLQSLTASQVEPASVRSVLEDDHSTRLLLKTNVKLTEAPTCPGCGNAAMPQALLFDEGYHSHTFYQFERAEEWLSRADCLVFLGTSFAVRLTSVALEHAREHALPVYNFNLEDLLPSTVRLSASNIVGPANETLPALVEACRQQKQVVVAVSKTTATGAAKGGADKDDEQAVVTDSSI